MLHAIDERGSYIIFVNFFTVVESSYPERFRKSSVYTWTQALSLHRY